MAITEVISIGSELTSGVSLDTNSQWLSRRLSEIGLEVRYHTSVSDDLEANKLAISLSAGRSEIVVATGGLGPTHDDLTREALAAIAGVPLEEDAGSLAHILAVFKMFNRPMPERNRVQALIPAGATVIPNLNGTAPGIWMEMGKTLIVCLPGVPREMQPMFDDWVLPRLKARMGNSEVILHRTIRCFGAGESQIEEMLGDLTKRGRHPEVAITASEATISLRVSAKGASESAALELIEPDLQLIRTILGELVFGEEEDTLQSAVGKMLKENHVTLSTAESCTGGMLGSMLTEIPGISDNYLGGVVSYSNRSKRDILSVPAPVIDSKGAVSEECAASMAQGCLKLFHSDFALSITGIAGPTGGTAEKPVGLVYVGLAHLDGVKVRNFRWGNDRHSTRVRACKMALNMLRMFLLHGE